MQEIKEASSEDQAKERWEEEVLNPSLKRHGERKPNFQTVSLEEINRLYGPSDVADIDFDHGVAFPGQFPYTRGIHATGHRDKLCTMRQFAGFGATQET